MSKPASDYTVDEIAITLGLKDNSYRRLIGESHLLKLWEGTTSNDPSFPPLLLPAVEPWQNLARMVSSSELINSLSRLRLLNSVFLVSQVSNLETNGTTVLVSLNRPSLSSSPPSSSTLLLSLSPSKARVHSSVPPRAYPSHYLASASEFSNFWTRVLVLIGVVGNASFDRFARKPIEGAKLLDSLLRMFADNFPGAAVLKSPVRSFLLCPFHREISTACK